MNCKAYTFDPILASALTGAGLPFEDVTWQNDVCASAIVAGCVKVFSDASDPADREQPERARYSVAPCDHEGEVSDGAIWVETESRPKARAAVLYIIAAVRGER